MYLPLQHFRALADENKMDNALKDGFGDSGADQMLL